MFTFEWITVVYAVAFAAVALLRLARAAAVVALGLASAVLLAAFLSPDWSRLFVPHVYLIAAYWLPALLVPETALRAPLTFEAWLAREDRKLREWLPRVPDALVPIAELAYVACYPLLPATFVLTWWAGTVADLDRFWTAVLVAGFASYASLPWLVSRPPRVVSAPAGTMPIRSFNVGLLRRVSHQWNTFPSGHVAVSVAAAGSLFVVWPAAGAAAFAVACGVGIGAAAGGYHYAIDVALGFLLGVAAAMLT